MAGGKKAEEAAYSFHWVVYMRVRGSGQSMAYYSNQLNFWRHVVSGAAE